MSQSITEWIDLVHGLALEKGWWDGAECRELTPDEINSKIMLIVTELAEAVECVREPDFEPRELYRTAGGKPEGFGVELADAVIRLKPEGFGVELADAVIRLFDLCGKLTSRSKH